MHGPLQKALTTATDHRGSLPHGVPRVSHDLYDRLGGAETIIALVTGLYDRIETDQEIRPMFVGSLQEERRKQIAFWSEWFGGPATYTRDHAYSGMRTRHSFTHITKRAANRWLSHFTTSLGECVSDKNLRSEVLALVKPMALALVNEDEPVARDKDLRCERTRHPRALAQASGRGKTPEIKQLFEDYPTKLTDAFLLAESMLAAACKGRIDVLEQLLRSGADIDLGSHHKQGCIFQSLMLTPLCGALHFERNQCVEFLLQRGAKYDIFSAAFLGDIEPIEALLQENPDLLHTSDPATDILEMTPLFHAVLGNQFDTVQFLLEKGAAVGKNSTAMLKFAANRDSSELTRLLLDHGADATQIGPGDWVLREDLVPLLKEAGAYPNVPETDWIWLTCTGNNSRRDNPELVAALLKEGADPHAMRRGFSALHFAAKAGFEGTIKVLLEHGVDPNRQGVRNETPLMWAMKGSKRADVAAVCQLLVDSGADPSLTDSKGRTALQRAKSRADIDAIKQVLATASSDHS